MNYGDLVSGLLFLRERFSGYQLNLLVTSGGPFLATADAKVLRFTRNRVGPLQTLTRRLLIQIGTDLRFGNHVD